MGLAALSLDLKPGRKPWKKGIVTVRFTVVLILRGFRLARSGGVVGLQKGLVGVGSVGMAGVRERKSI